MGYFIDANEILEPPTALTATRISTNVRDFGPTGTNALRNITGALQKWVRIYVPAALTSGGASTLTVTLESDSVVGLSSATVHATTGAIPKATLTTGAYIWLAVPADQTYERYVGLRFTVATDFTAGTIQADFSETRPQGNSLLISDGIPSLG
jgi:hypothetical protein